VCRGSARSVDGYDLHAALTACGAYLESFGGHQAAAGLTVRVDALEAFIEAITRHAGEHLGVDDLVPALRIDCDASMDELDARAVGGLAALSPFGRANRRPVVRMSDVTVTELPKTLGPHGKHLALRVRAQASGREMRVIWWNGASCAARLPRGTRMDVAVEPKLNHWNGRTTVEGEIRDVMLRG
jgi:single-stranded-DNA-specific exonuclease